MTPLVPQAIVEIEVFCPPKIQSYKCKFCRPSTVRKSIIDIFSIKVDPYLKTQNSDRVHVLNRGCISPNIKMSSSVLIPVCFCCLLTNWVDHWILQERKDVNEVIDVTVEDVVV